MSNLFTPGILESAAFQRFRYLAAWPLLGACFGAWLARVSRFDNADEHLYSQALLAYAILGLGVAGVLLLFPAKGRRLSVALLVATLAIYLGHLAYPWEGRSSGQVQPASAVKQP